MTIISITTADPKHNKEIKTKVQTEAKQINLQVAINNLFLFKEGKQSRLVKCGAIK